MLTNVVLTWFHFRLIVFVVYSTFSLYNYAVQKLIYVAEIFLESNLEWVTVV